MNPFELKGKINKYKNGHIQLLLTINNDKIFQLKKSKVEINNGNFSFSGKILYPLEAVFIIDDTLTTSKFFVDTGKQQTDLNLDSLNSFIIWGSKSNNEYLTDYQKNTQLSNDNMEEWYSNYWRLLDDFRKKLPAFYEDSMHKLKQKIFIQIDSALFSYVINHPDSYVALWNLYSYSTEKGYKLIYANTLKLFNKNLQGCLTGITIKKTLEVNKKISIGSIFPVIPVIDTFGIPHNVPKRALKKYTLIDFWFSKCPPCLSQFEQLKIIYNKYKNKEFDLLGISVDYLKNKDAWKAILNSYHLTWPQYWDVNHKQTGKLSVNFFPANFLLDDKGKIIAKNLEPSQIEEFLKEN